MDLKKIFGQAREVVRESTAKRVVVIEQLPDDSYKCEYVGLTARQQLLPMLRAAEKQFRVNLNRRVIQLSNSGGKLNAKGNIQKEF